MLYICENCKTHKIEHIDYDEQIRRLYVRDIVCGYIQNVFACVLTIVLYIWFLSLFPRISIEKTNL